MTFAESLRNCFDLAFTFSGRASRPEFWWFILFWVMTYITLVVVAALSLPGVLGEAVVTVFLMAMLLPMLAVSFRRLQDTGRNGWLAMTPIFGAALASFGRLANDPEIEFAGKMAEVGVLCVLVYWYAQPGERGSNAFGGDPLRSR
ncbi:MAG: DUF805 domain-containing protein [Pseudomonadota bacterium]